MKVRPLAGERQSLAGWFKWRSFVNEEVAALYRWLDSDDARCFEESSSVPGSHWCVYLIREVSWGLDECTLETRHQYISRESCPVCGGFFAACRCLPE